MQKVQEVQGVQEKDLVAREVQEDQEQDLVAQEDQEWGLVVQ